MSILLICLHQELFMLTSGYSISAWVDKMSKLLFNNATLIQLLACVQSHVHTDRCVMHYTDAPIICKISFNEVCCLHVSAYTHKARHWHLSRQVKASYYKRTSAATIWVNGYNCFCVFLDIRSWHWSGARSTSRLSTAVHGVIRLMSDFLFDRASLFSWVAGATREENSTVFPSRR